jgi:hypothetical protein
MVELNINELVNNQKNLHFNSSHRYHYDRQLHQWKGLNYHKLHSITKHFPKTHRREKHQQFQDMLLKNNIIQLMTLFNH